MPIGRPKTRKASMSFLYEPSTRKKSKKSRLSSRKNSAYNDKKRSKRKSRIQVSFDGHYHDILKDPQYTNLVIKNKGDDSTVTHRSSKLEDKETIELKYLRNRVEDETKRRKQAERERDTLIKSLDDMTAQVKKLEGTIREFEKENIDLYERIKKNNQEADQMNENHNSALRQITELQTEREKHKTEIENMSKMIEDQKLFIGQQSVEITQLRLTNMSNKENIKHLNVAVEQVAYMTNERKKVKCELDNIIKRRKSKKSLGCSNSFCHLPENKGYPCQPLKPSNSHYCLNTEKKAG